VNRRSVPFVAALRPVSTRRADSCFDQSASTNAASTRCAFVARSRARAPIGEAPAFPIRQHSGGAGDAAPAVPTQKPEARLESALRRLCSVGERRSRSPPVRPQQLALTQQPAMGVEPSVPSGELAQRRAEDLISLVE
jgi:hypothetical protein